MAVFNLRPAPVDVLLTRGDTFSLRYTVKSGGAPVDITGWTFRLTTDPSEAPPDDANNYFQVVGVVENGPAGIVRFDWTAAETGVVRDTFYDIQSVDPDGKVRTIARGQMNWDQDTTKNLS